MSHPGSGLSRFVQRRLLAIDFAFKKEQLKDKMAGGSPKNASAAGDFEAGGKPILAQPSRSFASAGSL